MTGRTRIAAATVCAALAMLSCMLYARHVRAEAERQRTESLARYGGEVVSLAVAVRTLEAGDVVSMRDVDMRDWVSALAPDDAVVDVEEVLGREVTVPVAAGIPLTALNFREATDMAEIPSGHVAVSIPITDRLGLSSGVATGSRVVAYRAEEDGAELIGEDVVVLSAPGASPMLSGRGSLVVAVRAQDVSALLAASASGDLRLVIPASDVHALAQGEAAANGVDVEPDEALPDGVGDVEPQGPTPVDEKTEEE